jgi:alkylated DNA repair dioxygenase AlkB
MLVLNNEHRLDLPNATIYWIPQWLESDRADSLMKNLIQDTPWEQPIYHFHGNDVLMPRQVAWYGDAGASYGYSGLRHMPLPFPMVLDEIRESLFSVTNEKFNSVLVNRYRDGRDSVAWHADDEKELGPEPLIASVSLGATRTFSLKPKSGGPIVKIELHHGSLLIMMGATQKNWFHQVAKTKKPTDERINLTFRQVDFKKSF